MDTAFERVLQISFSGSVIVLTVLVLRLILKRAPKRTVCLLWMIAVLRLLVPFEIESDWSLQPEPMEFAPPVVQEDFFDSGTVQPSVPTEFVEDAVEYPMPERPQQEEPVDFLPWIWMVGAAVLGIHGFVSYLHLKRRVRDSVILEEGVWLCPGLDSAFVLGFFRPRVYLPVLNAEERELVLLHERCHIRRLDHWWKPAAYAAVSIHWFNPLAWVTYILLCRDMELACDQETVKGMDNAKRKAYSAALLNCAAKRSGIAACPVAFGEISVKERIKMVLNDQKPGFWLTVIALIAAVVVGVFLLTSPRSDLERCERALKQWQEMDAWRFHESQSNVGELAENAWSVVDFWTSGEEHLMGFRYSEDGGFWQQWKDGKTYVRDFDSPDAGLENMGWQETEAQEKEVIPWVMRLDWDELTIHHWEASEDGKTVLLTVDFPTLGAGTLGFYFDDDEALRSVSRSFTHPNATVITGTIELMEAEQEAIEQEMGRLGINPELLQLYRELEALQNSDGVHLVIDMEIDSDYPGWETCRQEFIRTDTRDRFYRNFDYQSAAGPYTNSYLQYGKALYAREYSDAGVVADRGWERIRDNGAGELPLLNLDWTRFAVLGIEQMTDGSTVITMQGDLNQTTNTTYHEKTYEFHLDPKGKLTTQIVRYHASKRISDGFAEGTFEFQGEDTVHVLNTPAEELTKRILEVSKEVLGYRAAALKNGSE